MLRRVILKGFRSIKEMDLELRELNVFIGSNGAGKSNLFSFFKMLNEMMRERLQLFIATSGRAHSLLHYGSKVTPQIEARLEFDGASGPETYEIQLVYAPNDSLILSNEKLQVNPASGEGNAKYFSNGGQPRQETFLNALVDQPSVAVLRRMLGTCPVYHFHDTSATARVQQFGYIGDNALLLPDAGNLAAFLYRLEYQDHGAAYKRIVSTIRMIAPFFQDFELRPEGPNAQEIILRWKERDSDQVFGPHQLSDGTLRAIFLVTLLLQPEEDLPELIIVDEPELGLHPYALNVVASLLQMASHHSQVLINTQSSAFLDSFDAEAIIVVDRKGKESAFTRPALDTLESWLEEYSLSEVWEKNVIGGGPH
jgi:predicted ATPase